MRPDLVIPTEVADADVVPRRWLPPDVFITDPDVEEQQLESQNTKALVFVVSVAIALVVVVVYLISRNP